MYWTDDAREAIRRIHGRYERWIERFRACPVLSLDVRGYDLVADPSAIEAIAARVRARLEPELPQTELFPGALGRPAATVAS